MYSAAVESAGLFEGSLSFSGSPLSVASAVDPIAAVGCTVTDCFHVSMAVIALSLSEFLESSWLVLESVLLLGDLVDVTDCLIVRVDGDVLS